MSERKTSPQSEPPEPLPPPEVEAEVVSDGLVARDSNGALTMMRSGEQIIRIENETLMAASLARPRQIKAIEKAATEEIRAFPEEADALYYAIPYKDRKKNETVWVKGPAVGMARMLTRLYGNASLSARVIDVGENEAIVEGVAIDLQNAVRFTSQVTASRIKSKRGGGTYTLEPDKWQMEIKKALAIAKRNAAMELLPKPLVQRCYLLAQELATKQGADAKKRATMVAAFGALKPAITDEVLAFFAGVETIDDLTPEGFAHLRALYQGIKSGEVNGQDVIDQYNAALNADPTRDTLTGSADATGSIGEEPPPPPPPA